MCVGGGVLPVPVPALHCRWNLNVMPTLPGSLLRHLEEASELQFNEFCFGWLATHAPSCSGLPCVLPRALPRVPRARIGVHGGCVLVAISAMTTMTPGPMAEW
jgi:hypothetical protein